MSIRGGPAIARRSLLLAGAGALAAGCAVPALAQNQEREDEPVIVVTGKGLEDMPATTAYSVQDIARETLVSTASGRVEDALSRVAGFQQFRRSDSRSANPSAQGVTLRALGGNAASRAQLLLDGVPMSDPFFGSIPFSAIAPERLGSIRVTRGGGSGPFGSGALTGTIEMTSADAADLASVQASLLGNDRAETEASATFAPRLGAGFATLSGRWDRGRGFDTTPVSQRVPASVPARFAGWSVEARAVAPLTDAVELQARTLAYGDRRTLRFAGADTAIEGQDASLRLVGRGTWRFDVLGYVQARDFSNVVVSSRSFTPTLDQRNTPATGLGGKVELRPPVGGTHVLRLGADYRRASGQLSEDAISPVSGQVTARRQAGGTNTDLGFFVEDDWLLGAVTLTAGARADRFTIRDGFAREASPAGLVNVSRTYPDRAGWQASFRGGMVARLGGGLRLRTAAYTGLRLPTLNELYRSFTVFPVITEANASLRNERLEGYEGGLDWEPSEAVRLSLTGFDNRVRDAIANVTLATNLRQRQNIEAIAARGLEASAGLRLGLVSFDGALAYSDARARQAGADFDGLRPAQTPRWSANATAAFRPRAGWLLSATLRHVGAQFEDDLATDVLPAVTTIDAFAQVPLARGLSLVVRGENLGNAAIVTRNQVGSIDLGTPRTVWAGLKLGV